MTPLDIFRDEVKNSISMINQILNNIHKKDKTKLNYNEIELIFDFKTCIVEIYDGTGITTEGVQRLTFDKLVSVMSRYSY